VNAGRAALEGFNDGSEHLDRTGSWEAVTRITAGLGCVED